MQTSDAHRIESIDYSFAMRYLQPHLYLYFHLGNDG